MRSLILATTLISFAGHLLAAEVSPILLSGPEVAKVAWDTRSPSAADFDGDGKLDVALINNENAKLVILYQRALGEAAGKNARRALTRNRWEPTVEDSRFEKVALPADQRHYALVCGDFDGDKRVDLALTGAVDGLAVRFQAADGTFTKTWKWKDFEPLQGAEHLQTADLNGDGRADLAVLGKGKLLVFLQKAEGGFGEPSTFLTGEDKAGQLFAEDADGDGHVDLLYLATGGEGTMRWRRQISPGVFSAEVALPYAFPAYASFASRDAQKRLVFTRVNSKSSLIEQHTFLPSAPAPDDGGALLPTIYNLPGGMKISASVRGDLNGDGLTDLALADSRAAQIVLLLQQADGTFGEPQSFPSFTGITGLAAVQAADEKAASLVVTSRKEGLGFARLNAQGRLSFPTAVALKGEPAGVIALDPRGEGRMSTAAVLVDQSVWRIEFVAAPKAGATPEFAKTPRHLPDLKREPTGLLTADLNGDKHSDLLILVPREPAMLLLGAADGSGLAEPLKPTASFRAQLADLTPERVALVDLDGDQRAEVLLAGAGYARSLRLTPEQTDVVVADQFNARQPDQKLTTPSFFDTDGDGKPELVFGETGTAFFQVLKKDAAGVYRASRRLEAVAGELAFAGSVPLGTAGAPHLLALGRDRIWTAPFSGPRALLELTASYDTDLQNCNYFLALPGDLNNDGRPEMLAFDRSSNLFEVLEPGLTRGEPWRSLLHFALFEENIRFRGRRGENNVREVLLRDFTGDGKTDVLLLVHDRVLLYPQG